MFTHTRFPREHAPVLWFCSALASTAPQLMPIKNAAGPAVWSQPSKEGTNHTLEKGTDGLFKKKNKREREKHGFAEVKRWWGIQDAFKGD